jgi:hypothetical protein
LIASAKEATVFVELHADDDVCDDVRDVDAHAEDIVEKISLSGFKG